MSRTAVIRAVKMLRDARTPGSAKSRRSDNRPANGSSGPSAPTSLTRQGKVPAAWPQVCFEPMLFDAAEDTNVRLHRDGPKTCRNQIRFCQGFVAQ